MSAPAANQPVGDKAIIQVSTDSAAGFYSLGSFEEITGPKITSAEVNTTKLDSLVETSQAGIPKVSGAGAKFRFNSSLNGVIAGYQFNKTPLFAKIVPADIAAGGTRNSEGVFPVYVKEFDAYSTLKINNEIISTIEFGGAGSLTLATGA